jgi:hypothetical protein
MFTLCFFMYIYMFILSVAKLKWCYQMVKLTRVEEPRTRSQSVGARWLNRDDLSTNKRAMVDIRSDEYSNYFWILVDQWEHVSLKYAGACNQGHVISSGSLKLSKSKHGFQYHGPWRLEWSTTPVNHNNRVMVIIWWSYRWELITAVISCGALNVTSWAIFNSIWHPHVCR